MNIGDYVRTEKGEIYHIEHNEILKFLSKSNYHKIIKSSPNIIDLIEEDDLIKIEYELASGEKQSEVVEVIKSNSGEHKLFVNAWVRKCFIEDFKRYDIKIKSIVTKEQFESVQYKIGE